MRLKLLSWLYERLAKWVAEEPVRRTKGLFSAAIFLVVLVTALIDGLQ